MRLTLEQIKRAGARLRALAAKPAEPADFSIQEAIALLLDDLIAVDQAGHALAAALEGLNGDELNVHLSTLKSAKKRAQKAKKEGPTDKPKAAPGATRRGQHGSERRGNPGTQAPPGETTSVAGTLPVVPSAGQQHRASEDTRKPLETQSSGTVGATNASAPSSSGTENKPLSIVTSQAAPAQADGRELAASSAITQRERPLGQTSGGFRVRHDA